MFQSIRRRAGLFAIALLASLLLALPAFAETEIDDTDSSVTYVGDWRASASVNVLNGARNGTAHQTSEANAYVEVAFTGTYVELYSRIAPGIAIVDIYIDGEKADTVDGFSRDAASGYKMFEIRDLPPGPHTIRAVNTGQSNPDANNTNFFFDAIVYGGASAPVAEAVIVTGEGGSAAIADNGGTLQMLASVEPGTAPQTVMWSVYGEDGESATNLAAIDSHGLLTAINNGVVTVKAVSTVTPGVAGSVQIVITGQSLLPAAPLTALGFSADDLNLSPVFDPETYQYAATTSAASVAVTPVAGQGSITVNGEAVASGSPSGDIELLPGGNLILVTVSETGKADRTYRVTITRQMPFAISNTVIDKDNGVFATVDIVPAGLGGDAVVIFKLMDGTTPVSIMALESYIAESTTLKAQFPGYAGSTYRVRVLVWDQFDPTGVYMGIDYAAPADLD